MIRNALLVTAGIVTGAVLESKAVRACRCWFYGVKLNLITAEIRDTSEDILDAIDDGDAALESHLTDFYVQLCNERDALRRKLAALS